MPAHTEPDPGDPDAGEHQRERHRHGRLPYCSEEILATASKCKHCGEFLNTKLKRKADHNAGPLFRAIFIGLLLFVLWIVLSLFGFRAG